MHTSLNAILKITLRQAAVSIFGEISCENLKIFSFSRYEILCITCPSVSLLIRRHKQQASAWCRMKWKIDERDFVSCFEVCQKETEEKRFHPAIKARASEGSSFRTENISREKSSDFLKL